MKKILLIITLAIFAFNSQAQGRLQFNKVLTFVNDTSFSLGVGNTQLNLIQTWDIYTVPANRVVKISKAITAYRNSGYYCDINEYSFTVNGIRTESPLFEDSWIKAGDVIGAEVQLSTGPITSYNCYHNSDSFLSIIEYNIIPE